MYLAAAPLMPGGRSWVLRGTVLSNQQLYVNPTSRIGRLLQNPLLSTFLLCLCGIVLTIWSYLLGAAHFRNSHGCAAGFIDRPNCAAMYILVLPILFYLAINLLRVGTAKISALSSEPLSVIVKSGTGTPQQPFDEILADKVTSRYRVIFVSALMISMLVTFISLYLFFIHPVNLAEDWSQTYLHGSLLHRWSSIVLDCAVFVMQGLYVFLGLFLAGTIAAFVTEMGRLVFFPNTQFHFEPIIYDPQKRLGLSPVGSILTRIGFMALLFELYVAIYSIQNIADLQNKCTADYFTATLKKTLALGLGNVPHFDFGGLGTIALIALSAALWSCYSYIPLFVIRPFLARLRDTEWTNNARTLDRAKATNDETNFKSLEARFKSLRKTTFWPNGSRVGLGLCLALSCIPLLAIYPPAFGYVVASGFALAAYKALFASEG
jgi:hypothetical protein